ncbi:properdin-like [Chamaea fasciata]|uniref:properdin-like n=1 Tax=Chamaea fasciata TaxID=190680 RepID=UPI00336A1E7D
MAPPVLLLGLGLALLGAGAGHAAAPSVWCFTRLEEEADGGGACSKPLGEEQLPLADCCLNPAYGYKLHPQGHCRSCRPGVWGPWEPWSSCSVTCDEGTQRRGRSRRPGGGHGGDSTEWQLRACDMACCPVPGGWSPWSPWGGCSVTCGEGSQRRQRNCSNPLPRCGGSCGPGDSEDTRRCQATPATCPVPGAWGPWGSWGPCSGSCRGAGPGRSRRRRCDSPEPSRDPPGTPCPGSDTETQPCPGLPPCPVHGAWGAWSAATPCPVTCGLGGVVERRACDAPAPNHGGRGCAGPERRRGLCGPRDPCPALVHWGPWSPWSPCSRPWGDIACRSNVGQQRRTRECVGHSPGGPACPTAEDVGIIQLRACYNIQDCSLQGEWSDWSPWGLCTPPCGASPTRNRSRECRPILPKYNPTVPNVGSAGTSNVSFWGAARPRCAPLREERLRLEETRPCRNVRPCPPPEEQ